jgi:hypothetical protein
VANDLILDYNDFMSATRIRHNTKRLFLSIGLLVLISSAACLRSKGVLKDKGFQTRDTYYTIGEVPESWNRIGLRDADLAYVHRVDGSTLLINSNCTKTEDVPLLALTFHLLIGLTEQNILGHNTLQISGREALETTVEAKIDGVKRKMQILVFKKNSCVYDIVLSSLPEKFEENLVAYQSAVKGFDVPGAAP